MTTWVKVYDTLRGHRKSLEAGDRAMWLYVCGLSYANEQQTDGYIARVALPAVAPGVKSPERLATQLVNANYWHVVDGGWEIHDYLDVQRSAEDIRKLREKDAKRKRETSTRIPDGNDADSGKDSARNPDGLRSADTDTDKRAETELASSTSKVVSLHERAS